MRCCCHSWIIPGFYFYFSLSCLSINPEDVLATRAYSSHLSHHLVLEELAAERVACVSSSSMRPIPFAYSTLILFCMVGKDDVDVLGLLSDAWFLVSSVWYGFVILAGKAIFVFSCNIIIQPDLNAAGLLAA